MSTYSSALLNVGTLNATGTSGQLNATTATITNLTTQTVNTTGLSLTNLTIPGSFDITGLNNYTGKYQAGDIISYKNALDTSPYVSSTTSNTYWNYWYSQGVSGFIPKDCKPGYVNTSLNLYVYEIVYWGIDDVASDLVRMSATVIIPDKCLDPSGAIVSYKHQTLFTVFKNATLWSFMNNVVQATLAGLPQLVSPFGLDPAGWLIAANSGYIVVVADNPSYGISSGVVRYLDPTTETTSQYYANVALTQLMKLAPNIFNVESNYNIPTTVPVIVGGYSLGGLTSGIIGQFILTAPSLRSTFKNTNPNSIPLKLVNIVAGAPVNVEGLARVVLEQNYTKPTSLLYFLLYLLTSYAYTSSAQIANGTRPYIIARVLPCFKQLYINNLATAVSGIDNILYATLNSFYSEYLPITNPPPIDPSVNGAYILPPSVFGSQNDVSGGWIVPSSFYQNYIQDSSRNFYLSDIEAQANFFTNKFYDTSLMSGNGSVPINIIYSSQDEICCYNPNHWNSGNGFTNDLILPAFRSFVTGSRTGGAFNLPTNNLARTDLSSYVLPINTVDSSSSVTTIGVSLTNSERNRSVNSYMIDTSGYVSGGGHGQSNYTCYIPTLCAYLKQRVN